MRRSLPAILSVVFLGSVFMTGCKPDYPKCDNDDHCAEKGEVCVNGTCQECNDDTQCVEKYGEDHECVANKCEVKPECRIDSDCDAVGEGLVCRSNKCVPECTASEDCPNGMKCEDQKCVPECASDADCTPPEQCLDGACTEPMDSTTNVSGACIPTSGAGGDVVELVTIKFDFNDFAIRSDARDLLDQNAECLRQAAGQITVVLEGHADERGTQEYNLALGEKRANAVRKYLRNLGIDADIMTSRSMGENQPTCQQASESCYQDNRRVEFVQQRR